MFQRGLNLVFGVARVGSSFSHSGVGKLSTIEWGSMMGLSLKLWGDRQKEEESEIGNDLESKRRVSETKRRKRETIQKERH